MKPLLPDEIASEIRIPEDGCYCSLCEAARREMKPQTTVKGASDKKRLAPFTEESNRRLNKRV